MQITVDINLETLAADINEEVNDVDRETPESLRRWVEDNPEAIAEMVSLGIYTRLVE